MSALKRCKELGLDGGIKEAVEISTFPKNTLYDMYRKHPQKFEVVILGCVASKETQTIKG